MSDLQIKNMFISPTLHYYLYEYLYNIAGFQNFFEFMKRI